MFCRLISLLAVSLFLTGCSKPDPYWDKLKPLTNEEILNQVDNCRKEHRAEYYTNTRGEIVKIMCY